MTKTLLIGWAAADWRLLHPLREAGRLPSLNRLIAAGVVATPAPGAWRTVVTGEPGDRGEAASLWDDFTRAGRPVVVVRWPSLPVPLCPPSGSVWVGESFGRSPPAGHREDAPWPLAPGSVEPAECREALAELRVHPDEIGVEELRAFVPTLERGGPAWNDPAVGWLARALADATTTQNVATWLLETEPWDFAAIHFGALGAICRRFLPRSLTAEEHWTPYREVVATAFALHDRMLGRLRDLAGADATTLVCSERGLPGQPVAVLHGPGVRAGVQVENASALDLALTLRHLAGLPGDARPLGRVWTEALRPQAPFN